MRKGLIVLVVPLTFATSACTDHSGHDAMGGEHGVEAVVPGSPADASDATRAITIETSDTLRFDPSSIDVAVGETVTFVIHNGGDDVHEFTLGNDAYQEMHEGDMQEMQGEVHVTNMRMDNVVSVGPGETEELTWLFDEVGALMYGCHEEGHYAGGMVGTITVS